MAYLTIEEVKNRNIKVLEDFTEDQIIYLIGYFSKIIDEYCNTRFEPTEFSYLADHNNRIIVPKKPLLSVKKLLAYGSPQIENQTYFIYERKNIIVLKLENKEKNKRKALKIDYIYGYESAPFQVKETLFELLKTVALKDGETRSFKSERWDDYQYEVSETNHSYKDILSNLDLFIQSELDVDIGMINKVRARIL